MSLSHRYQDFNPSGFNPALMHSIPEEGLEDLKLDSFEDGYQAGWDDAIKAQVADKEHAVVEIAQRLQDISFTHEEAFVKLSAAMRPLLSKIAGCLLPEVAKKALDAHVLDQLSDLLERNAQNAIQITVAPRNLEPLQKLLADRLGAPFSLVPEASLSSGQVYLRVNASEREINLDAVQQGLAEALDAFFAQTLEDKRHG